MKKYIYLHGFASSPQSNKAQYLHDRFRELNIDLDILDLNQGDFSHLTLSRQIKQTVAAFTAQDSDITLIGSSFGGLTAAWVGAKYPQVKSLILLAPAFGFPASWLAKLGKEQIKQWQETGYLSVYHYGENKLLPLNYRFITDAEGYDESQLTRSLRLRGKQLLPSLIFHGLYDDVVSIEVSRNYAQKHPQVKLIELNSDHGLNDVKERIWQEIKTFCCL